MAREGQPKALLGLNRDRVLFRGPTGLRCDVRVNHANFPGANHRLHGRPVGRKAGGLLPCLHRASISRLRMTAISRSEYLVPTHSVRPAAASPEYSSGDASPSPVGPVVHTRTGFLHQPTHPPPKAGRPLQSASIPRGDGRSFRGAPRAPILTQRFAEGQDPPGILRVFHRPLAIPGTSFRNTFQPACPPYHQHRAQSPRRRSPWATPPGPGFAIPDHRQA